MGTNLASGVCAIHVAAISSALLIGFVIGISVTAGRGLRQQQQHQQPQQEQRQQPRGGTKRRARIRKSEDNANARAAGLTPPPRPVDGHAKNLSRRTRKHVKKPSSKDLALDAFVRVARSHIDCIGAGDYGSLLLLPRETFLDASRFVPYADCLEHLVTLGQARANTPGSSELRVLYVSCSWTISGGAPGDWTTKDFETTRAFLRRNPDLEYVYVGRSCVTNDTDDPVRITQLRHVPCALMRADAVLVLLRASDAADHGEDPPSSKWQRHSDFQSHARDAWLRMELALAAVGQGDVFVAFRAEPFAEAVCELASGKSDVGEMVGHAATSLRVAAAAARVGVANSTADGNGFHGSARFVGGTEGKDAENVVAKVKAACKNWLETELNPLAALEGARAAVAAAEKSGDVESLDSIRGMRRPIPTAEFTKAARESLGDERVEGDKELALSLLLFTVLCSKPKEPATYTDAFVDDAGKKEIRYRPVAVVRSPYRERFGTPRQPQVTASVLHGGAQEGQIVFLKGYGYGEYVEGPRLVFARPESGCFPSVSRFSVL